MTFPLRVFDLINVGFPTTEWAIANNEWRNILHAYLANVSYVDRPDWARLGRLGQQPLRGQYGRDALGRSWLSPW